MRQLLIRDVPEDVAAALREEAEERHTSLNSVALEAVREFAERRRRRKELERLLPAFDALRLAILERRGGAPTTETALLVREDRAR
ncbi:MAG: hypothetical protein IRZ26_08815 [Clostridia bacterium]|nr:hypothetical protein [Clostridia bacterium]MCL6647146.1 hypothetical protein [Chloroflexota bacterium]